MADPVKGTNNCSALKTEELRRSCEQRQAQLKTAQQRCDGRATPGTPPNDACKAAMEVCSSDAAGPYTLETDQQLFSAHTQDECMSMAPIIAGFGYTIKRVTTGRPNSQPPAAPAPGGRSANSSAAGSASPSGGGRQAGPGNNVQKPPAAPENLRARCDARSTPGTPQNSACKAAVDSCVSNTKGPYTLETAERSFSASNQDECVSLAPIIAGFGYTITKVTTAPQKPQSPSQPSPPSTGQTTNSSTDNGVPLVDNPLPTDAAGARLVKPFGDVNMRLRVTNGTFVEERRTLLFDGTNGIKGIPIRMRYSVTRLQPDRYRIAYSIYDKDGAQIGEAQSLDFDASGGSINLGFEVTLWSAGNFGSVKSIKIVPL